MLNNPHKLDAPNSTDYFTKFNWLTLNLECKKDQRYFEDSNRQVLKNTEHISSYFSKTWL